MAAFEGGVFDPVFFIEQQDRGPEVFGFLRVHLRVGADDDQVSRFDEVRGGAVDADLAGVAGAGDGVGRQAGAIGDVQYVHLLVRKDAGFFEQGGVDGDRALVIQIGAGDCGAVQLGLEQGQDHGLYFPCKRCVIWSS